MCKKLTGDREYKDNIFRLLFGNEDKSVELYNAINGTNYTPDAIKMNMLQNPFFFGPFRNDVSFMIGDKLIVLFEHNSSINPNMGLRFLFYVAEIYDVLINRKDMYKRAKMSIPNPEFYMLYNGKEKYPDNFIVKLSDLFKVQDGGENNLELIVRVINVNKGHNKNIMERSRTLGEYAEFVAKVRGYIDSSGLELTKALKKAIEDCVRNNILREFLEKHGGEVVNILQREFNLDEFIEVRTEEAREEAEKKFEAKEKELQDEISQLKAKIAKLEKK